MESAYVENKKKYIGVLGAFALSVGTAIGWGSFVITGSNYLSKAGLLGSIIGIVLGTVLMGVIAYCYHYMINKVPDSGGIYSFVKHTFNADHAFLASWFLIVVYFSILWANVTSIALFSRFLLGGIFQFGRLYSIAGYDVYLGEVLLCAGVLLLFGGLTFLNKKITTNITFGMVAFFVAAIIFVTLFCLIKQNGFSFQEVSFASGDNHIGQITSVFAMTPWAYIGFESISHSTGSFSFKTKKTIWILLVSLAVSALVYILLCYVSVLAHPDTYASWLDYIANNHEAGIMGIPPFFVAKYYMGDVGVTIFGFALLAIIATSIIGNIYAVSNLIHRMAEDGIFPTKLVRVNGNDIPIYVRFLVIGSTLAAILLGRSVIGYIVDVNNIGGAIVYGYVSACAMVIGFRKKEKLAMVFGIIGLISSCIFALVHIGPVFSVEGSVAQETFMAIVICCLLGFTLYAFMLRRDDKGNFGNSSIAWIVFSLMVVFFSGIWIIERSKNIHSAVLGRVEAYYEMLGGATADRVYLDSIEAYADRQNMVGIITLMIVVTLTLVILFLALYFIKENERKYKRSLESVSEVANKDALTGVGNHHAYIDNEKRILAKMKDTPNYPFGIVVCDINDLKYINDRFGHDFGDEYIRKACNLICKTYKRSPVFRIGGDEFVVILENDDYNNRHRLLAEINSYSAKNINTDNDVVIAAGMAVNQGSEGFADVFRRADKLMYGDKESLKKKRPSHHLR